MIFTTDKTFAPGARVVVRDEEWLVRRVSRTQTGGTIIRTLGLSELVRNQEAVFLTELDTIEELRPEDTKLVPDESTQFNRSRLYLESLLRRTPPTDANIYLGHRGALNDTPFQLQPAHMALTALRPRILIADGVGLGKTVEVGILLSELIKRGRGDRILVVAIKSMLAQFQQEIWARFAIPLVRLDSVGIQRVRAKIPSNKNPFYYFNRVIVSVDTLKNDAQYRHYLEQCHWDVIVIDECHNVANAGSQRNRLASLLSRTCDSLILTSATPHNGKPQSFANLMTMLEPTAIADPNDYSKEEIDGLFVRRFKKDVEDEVSGNFQERQVHLEKAKTTAAESAFFAALNASDFHTHDALYRIGLFKEFLSSPAAAVATLDNRLHTIARQMEARQLPENKHRKYRRTVEELATDRSTLATLRQHAAAVTAAEFSKYQFLLGLLKRLQVDASAQSPRVIIFSERLATLQFLQDQLQAHLGVGDEAIVQFHAGLLDTDQQNIVEDFGKEDSRKRILLASDAASEGVNLHYYCHLMIHFDIPWSLIRLEQRNGRIDRYGQKQVPYIHYLVTDSDAADTEADLRILRNLIEKEEQAYKNIGDAASILHLYNAEQEDERITRGVAEGKDLDTIIEDVTAETSAEEFDFLALLLGDADDDLPSADVCAATPSLYTDDLAFARVAFQELQQSGNQHGFQLPDYHPERAELAFVAPPDLQRRLTFIPDEAIPPHWLFNLTTDRAAMMRSMEDARKQQGVWPKLQLFWELHPVMEWLLDRLLAQFGRNEAPVITTPHLAEDQAIYLIQSIISNQRSQPVITRWFGIQRTLGGSHRDKQILSFAQVLAQTRFADGLANQVADIAVDRLASLLPEVVVQAGDHMRQLRTERGQELGSQIRADQRKLQAWYKKAIYRIDSDLMHADGVKTARLNREREHVKALMQQRSEWLRDAMATDPNPYIRVAAVFTGQA